MSLTAGSRLGPYEILAPLGAGGMGEVFKARDTRLGRLVAVKILPPDKVGDPGRRQRFLQEAQAASALNHPNIITIHDWIEEGGQHALVMEYVAGKTLEQIIPPKGMRVRDTLKYAAQIADALAAAHAVDIVHRDIKPGNIMVTDEGRVKVLDFGLAKLRDVDPADSYEATRTARAVSAEGTVLGTAAYMSPEQAEGKTVDARSDVFSFGAVLYEMLTGRRAFQGDTRASIMASVIKDEPKAVSNVVEDVPRELERIVTRCLRKDLERRSRSMAEIRLELDELREESESGHAAAVAHTAKPSRRFPLAALSAAVAVVAAAGAYLVWRQFGEQRVPTYRLRQITRDSGRTYSPALSPDGKLLAFASDRAGAGNLDIWVQQTSGGEPVRLTRHPADEDQPNFSPDGGRILFLRAGAAYVIPSLGGSERMIAPNANRAVFSPDGKWIAVTAGYTSSPSSWGIWVYPASGGAGRKIDTDVQQFTTPVWSPSGEHLLVTVVPSVASNANIFVRKNEWYLVSLAGGKAIPVRTEAAFRSVGLQWAEPTSWLSNPTRVIVRGDNGQTENIWQLTLDEGTGNVLGKPVRLTYGTTEVPGQPSAAALIPFETGAATATIYSFRLDVEKGVASGPLERALQPGGAAIFPTLTADATKMVFTSNRFGSSDVWMRDMATGEESTLVATPEPEQRGVISPDGQKLAFTRLENGKSIVHYLVSLPSGPETRLCEGCRSLMGFTPDSRSVLLTEGSPEHLYIQDLETGRKWVPVTHPRYSIHDGRVSPDSHWYAFKLVIDSNHQPAFVAPFRDGSTAPESEWVKISDDSFTSRPFWAPGGGLIYFYSRHEGTLCLFARRFDPKGGKPQGDAFAVRHFHDGPRLDTTGARVGYGLAKDRLYIPASEQTANIWIAEPER